MYKVINKYTGEVLYSGTDKKAAKAAYKADTASFVYKDGRPCDLRTFEPRSANH